MLTVAAEKKVRVRMAPSPTGNLHIGTARTALFNFLFARHYGGEFILRIEDTDKERSSPEFEIQIIEGLKWLGIDWDEGPDRQQENGRWHPRERGAHGPYRQSERTAIYKEYLEKILKAGRAYYCYCTKEELDAQRQLLLAEGHPAVYPGHCRELANSPPGKTPQVIRFKTPAAQIEFKDLIRGKVTIDTGLLGDMVIAKSITEPLYNFAAVIDDYLMAITHVIRGEDHLSNTPKQILLQKALGLPDVQYAHLPLILGADRTKLSKRTGETSLLEYKRQGYLPQTIVNFIALLGWHPEDDNEVLTMPELIKAFDLHGVQKSGAIFNPEKLEWFNVQHLRCLSPAELAETLQPFLTESQRRAEKNFLYNIIRLERERLKTLADFAKNANFFFELPPYEAKLLLWKDNTAPGARAVLQKLVSIFSALPEEKYTKTDLAVALNDLLTEKGRGNVLWPLRVAVSGRAASPDPLEIMEILKKEETLKRLKTAIGKFGLDIQ